jgi:hypothetical protein
MSLYIAHVFPNISKNRIAAVFEDGDFGRVDIIDFVKKTDRNGKKYHSVYIYFERWNIAEAWVCRFIAEIQSGKTCTVSYDDPWFWKVTMNKTAPNILPIAPGLSRPHTLETPREKEERSRPRSPSGPPPRARSPSGPPPRARSPSGPPPPLLEKREVETKERPILQLQMPRSPSCSPLRTRSPSPAIKYKFRSNGLECVHHEETNTSLFKEDDSFWKKVEINSTRPRSPIEPRSPTGPPTPILTKLGPMRTAAQKNKSRKIPVETVRPRTPSPPRSRTPTVPPPLIKTFAEILKEDGPTSALPKRIKVVKPKSNRIIPPLPQVFLEEESYEIV